MATITKTVRFSSKELKTIEQFLDANPFLDFSTLVRMATLSFVEKPAIALKAVGAKMSGATLKGNGGVVNE
jgi:mevalonate kinase